MDTQLKELIETIKAEGVQSAEKQAEQIVAAAEEKAQEITSDARQQAAGIVEEAKADRARQEAAGTEAVKQAAQRSDPERAESTDFDLQTRHRGQ